MLRSLVGSEMCIRDSDEPVHYDSGSAATCTDDQGTRFHLSVPADKYRR